ncbi:CRISPR-associated endonuclease Cas6 [Cyclobacterium qasimii]|uniref:DNA repair protein n=1 Tax=Cyclobacterium qasimii TaxID=1350429 RepID=A0A512CJH4_9BACT|nr:CRISPR-associated endonuclease Cas6 [Cyclobacterium qasimii]GEO24140.1 hypothetical protein CQA01_46740 [Cyclobacterium qasimii]
MPNIKVIKIIFDTILKTHEIPAFRGAIINVVGREHVIFHNHLGDKQYHYAYPLVQYKTQGRNAGIVCIGDGVDEIHHFFTKNEGMIRLGNQQRSLQVEHVKLNKFQVEVSETSTHYQIKDWLALNDKNYQRFEQLELLQEKLVFLEKILIGNILSFAKGVGWTVDQPIQANITGLPESSWVRHKGIKLKAMDLTFRSNVSLPEDIGLGKGASTGFGTLQKIKNKNLSI